MTRITEDLVRKRAEHNDGILATLEEVSLHQLNIEKIELLGHMCKHLRILYFQSNLIARLENLHKLKELEYLNMAVNNLTKIQNLQRCESLQKLDLTVNFLDKAGLLSVQSLQHNDHLADLYLLGNPCAEWHGYRPFIVGTLPQLRKLDGQQIPPSEGIAARQMLPGLLQQLRQELLAEGIDPDKAAQVEDDSVTSDDIAETGYRDESGEMRRPWCPATRILEHRESQAQEAEAESRRKAQQQSYCNPDDIKTQLREDFPAIQEGEDIRQKNEGKWEFTLQDSANGAAVELDVEIGRDGCCSCACRVRCGLTAAKLSVALLLVTCCSQCPRRIYLVLHPTLHTPGPVQAYQHMIDHQRCPQKFSQSAECPKRAQATQE
ncbi:TPA: hypothetical protein ACH3X3_008405 [Trebouxia sp. C0006]